jgi:hypothetical protein
MQWKWSGNDRSRRKAAEELNFIRRPAYYKKLIDAEQIDMTPWHIFKIVGGISVTRMHHATNTKKCWLTFTFTTSLEEGEGKGEGEGGDPTVAAASSTRNVIPK